jgi:hypothetical protein
MSERYTAERLRQIREEAAARFAAEPKPAPQRWAQQARNYMPSRHQAATTMGSLGDRLRQHPVPFALLAFGLGWLLIDRMRSEPHRVRRQHRHARFEHHTHVSDSRPDRPVGRAPDADRLIGGDRSGKSAEDSARTLLGPDGRPLPRREAGGTTTVGWSQPERNAGQSVRMAAAAAEDLNRAGGLPGADNPMSDEERVRQRLTGVRDDTSPVFDRP